MPSSSGQVEISLTKEQRKALFEALLSAFSEAQMQRLLSFGLDASLEEVVGGESKRDKFFNLIGWLESRGRVGEFIEQAQRDNPGNPGLRAICAELGLAREEPLRDRLTRTLERFAGELGVSPDSSRERRFEEVLSAFRTELGLPPPTHSRPSSPGPRGAEPQRREKLERRVSEPGAYFDLSVMDWLARVSRRVCRMEIHGKPAATGFLVGPSAVLTVFHAVAKHLESGDFSGVRCRFDFLQTGGTTSGGLAVELSSTTPILDSSPFSPADLGGEGLPDPAQLDYAALRLEEPVGEERGWMSLEGAILPKERQPVLVVQHPGGGPLKVSLPPGEIGRLNENETRLEYSALTEPGSAGAPCFSLQGELVAMHHATDPDWRISDGERERRAIPAFAINRLLRERAVELE